MSAPVNLREQCVYLAWEQGLDPVSGEVSPGRLFDLWSPLIRADERANLPEGWTTVTAIARNCERIARAIEALEPSLDMSGETDGSDEMQARAARIARSIP